MLLLSVVFAGWLGPDLPGFSAPPPHHHHEPACACRRMKASGAPESRRR
jgi:hypothetical protein